jgi:tRNA pseudouridine38-40 synthase
MVRYLVGTLVEVATGRREVEELELLLAEEQGVRPPSPAPPWGLYLTGVRYPDGWNRPQGVPGLPMGGAGDAAE